MEKVKKILTEVIKIGGWVVALFQAILGTLPN
nr:MAG TPA: syndecan-2 protein [Microviridae sp.]